MAFTGAILFTPALIVSELLLSGRKSGDPSSGCGVDRASLLGVLLASAAVLVLGLSPLFAKRPPLPQAPLKDTLGSATFISAQAHLSLTSEAANIDTENSVSVTSHKHSTSGTIYAPVHVPASKEVLAFVSGTEVDWRNANIQTLPFPNAANEAAVARSGDAILSLQPVPLIVRREWADKGLSVPLLLSAFQWGRSPLAANVPLLLGGGTVFILCFIALLRRPKPVVFT
ncbi:MAG: hypothetical protein KA004_19515 [Verrucomicrobiales bacterium]|nr:hypothetical protein [Verrucomicrobiales bacterium]